MNIRQFHRWMAISFTVTIIAYLIAMPLGTPPAWLTYLPLVPLAFLLFTGLYLFLRPHVTS